ncbi:MAG: chitobiase/beta-hexosaminidase C-terminal domain-containing protein [Chthoniobacter sp.]|uniref:chitobiase/beta-hexosaminidase C-terminal domain-containing protein n=1 Tax=Chthoniobacter sp. TaxID=2510640 RepID=UPI0032A4FFDC
MKLSNHLAFLTLAAASFLAAGTTEIRAETPAPICNRVRFQPTAGGGKDMVGGKIEGSNVSRTEGFVTLAEIKEPPTTKDWEELKFDNSKVYRYLRCSLPRTGQGTIHKVEFYDGDRLLAGEGKGSPVNYFLADAQDSRTAGYDLGDTAASRRIIFNPNNDEPRWPIEVRLVAVSGTEIRYTLDGSLPTADHGEIYQGPIHIEKTTTISAVGIAPDFPPSLPTTLTYLFPGSSKPGLTTAHVGNSLTGTTSNFWRFARTAGYDHKSVAFLRGGALTRELFALASGEFASDRQASAKEEAAIKKGSVPWPVFWSKVGKIDALTMQPRDFDLDKEIAAEVHFLKLFRGKSPDVQPYLYCEWVELARQRPSDKGMVPSYQMAKTFPALTWEESMSAMLLYVEELQHRLATAYPEGRPVHIIPAALAMGWIKNRIDHGQFPDARPGSFYSLLFNDQVHPGPNGAFLVDMTWFPVFYREAPEGKVLPMETTLTPAQALAAQRLAWDVIQNYPDCGFYQEGTAPCGKPEFTNDGKIITLKSPTPGAWFRYTLDGTTPTRTRGYVYCGAISVQPDIQLKAVAYKSGMADSEVAAP